MGLVNVVVPLAQLEAETLTWCREMLRNRRGNETPLQQARKRNAASGQATRWTMGGPSMWAQNTTARVGRESGARRGRAGGADAY